MLSTQRDFYWFKLKLRISWLHLETLESVSLQLRQVQYTLLLSAIKQFRALCCKQDARTGDDRGQRHDTWGADNLMSLMWQVIVNSQSSTQTLFSGSW